MKIGNQILHKLMSKRIHLADDTYTTVGSLINAYMLEIRLKVWEWTKLRRLGITREQLLRRLKWQSKLKEDNDE
jgi:hypothetical protein